jgi:hypothetical protein
MPSNADDRRWRVFEQADGAILAVSGTDEASDDLGSPFFRCQKKSDRIEVHGTANQDLRNTMADLIRSGGYPSISLLPEGAPQFDRAGFVVQRNGRRLGLQIRSAGKRPGDPRIPAYWQIGIQARSNPCA